MKRAPALLLSAALLVACASPSATAFTDGVRLFREGQFAPARDAFEKVVRLDPNLPEGWNNRGVTRARLGDLGGAVSDYTRAFELAPTDAEIVFNRGNAYAADGQLPEAIGDFTRATTLRPEYAPAYFNRGTLRAMLGDSAGAVADWQSAIAAERDPWAKAAMRRAAGLDIAAAPGAIVSPPGGVGAGAPPLDVPALIARAMSRELEGDRAGAIADLRAALIAEPDGERRARIDRLVRALEAPR